MPKQRMARRSARWAASLSPERLPMVHVSRFRSYTAEQSSRVASVWRSAAAQPGWITRVALLTFLLVVGLPILLLLVMAVIFAAAVFGVLALVNVVLVRLRGALPQRDGRSNVRVIRRGPDV